MPILISETYEIMTPESAAIGEHEEIGFNFKYEQYTFRELVDYLKRKGYRHNHGRWVSTDFETTDYRTGEEESLSLHPASDSRSQRYFWKAVRIAL